MMIGTMANDILSLFGLTTISELRKVEKSRDYWKKLLTETNESIEQLQQLYNAIQANYKKSLNNNAQLEQELADSKAWATHLEETNKTQTELIAKQQEAITNALNEASTIAALRNEADLKVTSLKLENKRYRDTVKMAIDNLALEIN